MIKHSAKYNPNVTGDQRVGKAHGSHTIVSVNKPKSNTTISQSELERRLNIVESHIAKLLLFKDSSVLNIKELNTYAKNDNRQINLINKSIKDMQFELNLLDDAFKSHAAESAINDIRVDINLLRNSVGILERRNKRNFMSRLLSRWARKLGDIWHVIRE